MKMNKYETIVIINPDKTEEEVNKIADKYRKQLGELGSQVNDVEYWGKREVAGNFDGFTYAHYLCFMHETDNTEVVKVVNQSFLIDVDVLKYQTHTTGAKSKVYKVNRRLQNMTDDSIIGA